MCGLAGFVDPNGNRSAEALVQQARRMADQLAHRGPDDSGEWVDEACQLAFGHRRLSIIDTSTLGHQPMTSSNERYVIAYNGEIYNFRSIRRDLERSGVKFAGNSDTEVVLAAIDRHGLQSALQSFVGMFAFALFDREQRMLYLVRDRIGIKPLYYGYAGSAFVFGSELKSLTCYPGFDNPVDRHALSLYARLSCVPAPFSIYRGISKLLPGTIVSVPVDSPGKLQTDTYWNPGAVCRRGIDDPFAGSDQDAIAALDELLTDAIRLRMIADVPLGAFLSGGYDSSLVAAIMQREASDAVKTFSIGFENRDFDESMHAEAVARHLGTDHTALTVTSAEAQAVIPGLPRLYDEPFADSSQIPTYLVSKLARQHVTVSLSGDGGDELFAGYNRHVWVERLWKWMRLSPVGLRSALGRGVAGVSAASWDRASGRAGRVVPWFRQQRRVGENMHKLAGVLAARDPMDIYEQLVSHWRSADGLVLSKDAEPSDALADRRLDECPELAHKLLLLDQTRYLPDDILTKVDRASMGVSLEARVPLIDHRVYEFSWRLPHSMKVRNGKGKWITRQLTHELVPRALMERPKAGFGIPIGDWLRTSLRDWAEDLIRPEKLRQQGYFDERVVTRTWDQYVSGAGSWHYHVWDILMFQAWLDEATAGRQRDA